MVKENKERAKHKPNYKRTEGLDRNTGTGKRAKHAQVIYKRLYECIRPEQFGI